MSLVNLKDRKLDLGKEKHLADKDSKILKRFLNPSPGCRLQSVWPLPPCYRSVCLFFNSQNTENKISLNLLIGFTGSVLHAYLHSSSPQPIR